MGIKIDYGTPGKAILKAAGSQPIVSAGKWALETMATGKSKGTTFAQDIDNKDRDEAARANRPAQIAAEKAAAEAERIKQEQRAKQQMSLQQTGQLATQSRDLYKNQTGQLLDPVAEQMQTAAGTQIGVNVDPAFRQYQMGLAQQLQQQAMGQGPSIAQEQLKQATDRTMQQSLGNIKAGMGANSALAARTAAMSGSQQLGQMGGNSAILRLQEQQQAQQMLGQVSGQARGQDVDVAGLGQAAQIAQAQNTLGALNGMGNVRANQLGAYGNLYAGDQTANQAALGRDSTAMEAEKKREFDAQQAELVRADERKKAREKQKGGMENQLLGGAITAAATYFSK